MAQETNILLQVSDDGLSWSDLVTLTNGSVSHRHEGLALGTTRYYRTIAKGDGVNTLDSPPSASVSVASGFVQRYQDVLDYANANAIGTPSFTQNLINDRIVRNLIKEGILHESDKTQDKTDTLWYFQQEAGTPYEFLTLNWIDPTKHRLTNAGTEDLDFVGGSGFKTTGTTKWFNTNYTPSTDAVHYGANDSCVVFKTFDIPTTFAGESKILGANNANDTHTQISNTPDSTLLLKVNGDYGAVAENSFTISQSLINGTFAVSDETTSHKKLFRDGSLHLEKSNNFGGNLPNIPIYLFAVNTGSGQNSTGVSRGLGFVSFGSSMLYAQDILNNILNNTYFFKENTTPGELKITAANSVLPSLYYPKVKIAEPYKALFPGITKKYLILYSTNHAGDGATSDPSNGAIFWGQADHPNLDGFEEGGVITSGYQSETPDCLINPNDPNGETFWLFYHPGTTYPGAGGIQQTRLWTTSGGNTPHEATYTDRGTVLGITATENSYSVPHLGYPECYLEDDGSITVIHTVKGYESATSSGITKKGISTCPGNNYTFTRTVQDVDITSFMPYFRLLHASPSLFFDRNGIQYCVARNAIWEVTNLQNYSDSVKISVYQCDGNYQPTALIGNISGPDSGNKNSNAGYYIEGDTLYVYYIMGATDLYVGTWDLKNLD
ncbi:hypothetical protein C7S20_00025 [Christiangramia fulva]|uniref:Uncharacterized protein n=1 Tax=Christiangramia fulva TaxID=2126553 RepID=A0A2R3Z0K3_9FLAO|nr:hypothetical protein [Christiangramia fulva]AVR43785.1 hypothetical protein C7S20_00025 [Christiangramia fulva]